MGSNVGCVIDASEVSAETVHALVSEHELRMVFVRGAMALPSARAKSPVVPTEDRVPGMRLVEDDSALRAALGAASAAGADVYLVLSNPLAGRAEWTDLLARDSGGRLASDIDPDRPVLCPNQPKLLKWLATAAAEAVKKYKPTGVLLEDFSLGRPGQIDPLFACWCDLCQARAGELGYDADRLRIGMQGARTKLAGAGARLAGLADVGLGQFVDAIGYDTGLLDWLNFRADSVSACLYEVRMAVAGVDSGLRVAVQGQAPSVAMLAGQRPADSRRDATLADLYIPVVSGTASGVVATLVGHAAALKASGFPGEDSAALAAAAELHGYGGLDVPLELGHLTGSVTPTLRGSVAERELGRAMAAGGAVPVWPALDLRGVPAGGGADAVRRVTESEAEGLVYLGVPH